MSKAQVVEVNKVLAHSICLALFCPLPCNEIFTEHFSAALCLFVYFRHQPKLTEDLQKTHHQQFEFRNGKIINCSFRNLALGVENSDLRSGAEVVLLEKKCDSINQHWIWREDSR